jgi:hypothetical protein
MFLVRPLPILELLQLQDPEGEKLLTEHNRALEAAEALRGTPFKPKMTRSIFEAVVLVFRV